MIISGWLYLLQQSLCAWGLLAALGRCLGVRTGPRSILAALSLGSMAALAQCTGLLPPWLTFIALVLFAPAAAFPRLPRSVRPRACLALLALTLLWVGCAHLLSFLPPVLLPAALCMLLPIAARLHAAQGESPLAAVELHHQGHRLHLTALVDSGNLLRDPLTGLPVIVVSRPAAQRLLGVQAFTPGMRLISVRTVAGSSLMAVFRPALVRVRTGGPWQQVQAIIGLGPDGYHGFQALVPASLAQRPPSFQARRSL